MPRRKVTAVEAIIGFNEGPTIPYGTLITKDMLNASLVGLEVTFQIQDGDTVTEHKKNFTDLRNISDDSGPLWKISDIESDDFTYTINNKTVQAGDLAPAGLSQEFKASLPAGFSAVFREYPLDDTSTEPLVEYTVDIPSKSEVREISVTPASPKLEFRHKDYYHLQCKSGAAVACPTLDRDGASVYLFDSSGNRQKTQAGISIVGSISCPGCNDERVSEIVISYGPTLQYYKEEIRFPITVKVAKLDLAGNNN